MKTRPEIPKKRDARIAPRKTDASASQKSVPTPGRKIGYVRVSTGEQNHDLQLDALTAAGVADIREETASGKRRDRPVLTRLLDELVRGDVLVCWKIDRVARSTRHLLEIVEAFTERGIGFVATTQQIDTTTATGRFFVTVLAAVAELETETIRERVTAGRAAARIRGTRFGRTPKVTPSKLEAARRLLATDPTASVSSVSRTLGLGRSTLYRALGPENEAIPGPTTRAKARR